MSQDYLRFNGRRCVNVEDIDDGSPRGERYNAVCATSEFYVDPLFYGIHRF